MNHKATPEQWANVEQAYEPTEISPGVFVEDRNTTFAACLLELRARVEALEAAANSSAGLTSSAPAVSLVDRVADAIVEEATSAGIVNDRPARAAIREVAAAARDAGLTAAAKWLEQQAER